MADKVTYIEAAWDVYVKLETQLKFRFCIHHYNIKHQYVSLKDLREKLPNDEAILHIDFSENYALKYDSEIQAMHFGANNRTASLHADMCYVGQDSAIGFCSISANGQHDAAGIWAHLSLCWRTWYHLLRSKRYT